MLVIIFTISMFLYSALLFVVEPMLAKMILPHLGGTAAVWNTGLVFLSGNASGWLSLRARLAEMAGAQNTNCVSHRRSPAPAALDRSVAPAPPIGLGASGAKQSVPMDSGAFVGFCRPAVLCAFLEHAHAAALVCMVENDINVPQAEIDQGRFPSIWVVMPRNQADLAYLAAETGYPAKWQPMKVKSGSRLWTDYSSLLSAI